MTTPGDPHRPRRREGGEDRPRGPGGRLPAASPDDPTTIMPQVTRDPGNPGVWVAGSAGSGSIGSTGPVGPSGATAYSVDSPDLFPPLPEPEPRRPARGRWGVPPEPSARQEADPGARMSSREPDGRWGEFRPGATPGARPATGPRPSAGPRRAAGTWRDGGPPPFAWPDDAPGSTGGMHASDGPGDEQPPSGDREPQWREGYGPAGPTGFPPGGYRPSAEGPYKGAWPPRRGKGTAAATTALVLGIAGLLLLFVCGIGVVVAIAGVVVAIVALVRGGAARGRALAGLILSALTLIIAAAFVAWLASTGVARCLDETLYPTQGDVEVCLEERLGVQLTVN